MPIHPTALIDPAAEIDAGADIGPYCIIGAEVHIGARTRLMANNYLEGPTWIGEHPARQFLGILVLFLLFLLDFRHRDVGRELERLHAERHRLGQRADTTENGVLEDR